MRKGQTTYTVTVDGREFKRTSFSKYTHYIVRTYNGIGGRVTSDVVGWSGDYANATKAMRQKQAAWPEHRYEVREIEDVRWAEQDGVITLSI